MEFRFLIWGAIVMIMLCLLMVNYLRRYSDKLVSQSKSNELLIYAQRFSGMVLYGILPASIIYGITGSLDGYGVRMVNLMQIVKLFMVAMLVVLPLSISRARTEKNLSVYPQIRVSHWNSRMILFSSLSWLGYLLAYEFFFRGLLLFACQKVAGDSIAVVINVALYVLVHVPKGRFETIGAIPVGIIFCMLTLYTGSFWLAFGIHSAIALSNEWSSISFGRRQVMQTYH